MYLIVDNGPLSVPCEMQRFYVHNYAYRFSCVPYKVQFWYRDAVSKDSEFFHVSF
jgi:hypothetical protein